MIANTRPKAMYMLLYCISKESNDWGPLNWTGTHISDILTTNYLSVIKVKCILI